MGTFDRKNPTSDEIAQFNLIIGSTDKKDSPSIKRLVKNFELGNIRFSKFNAIEMCFASQFQEANGAVERDKMRNQISSDLRKNGFSYNVLGYIKK